MDKAEIFKLILEIVVLIGTIISAVVTEVNKRKTKEDVDYIKQVKDAIFSKQKMEDISIVTEKVKSILDKVSLYSNKIKKTTSRGLNLNKEVSEMKESLVVVKSNRSIFNKSISCTDEKYVDNVYKSVNEKLNSIVDMSYTDSDEIANELRDVESILSELLAKLKELADERKYD